MKGVLVLAFQETKEENNECAAKEIQIHFNPIRRQHNANAMGEKTQKKYRPGGGGFDFETLSMAVAMRDLIPAEMLICWSDPDACE